MYSRPGALLRHGMDFPYSANNNMYRCAMTRLAAEFVCYYSAMYPNIIEYSPVQIDLRRVA